MSIRFLGDADLNHFIIEGSLRQERVLDFMLAVDAGLPGRPDPDVLAIAARFDRVLVSHDDRTMPVHFARFLRDGNRSPGVLLISQSVRVSQCALQLIPYF